MKKNKPEIQELSSYRNDVFMAKKEKGTRQIIERPQSWALKRFFSS